MGNFSPLPFSFHSNLVEECEDRNFWEVVKMFSERVFLVPAPPPGYLSVVSVCL